jgi:gamma-polyglutamate synthase
MWWQDLKPGIYIAVILLAIIIALFIEAIRHRTALNKIPIRIHVNGTRGKSSVTRLIAAGLRAGGLITSAKTTGTLPRFIYPDGQEKSIYRMGHSNIAEQIQIVREAAKLHSQALVIECMSLQPLLQSICELKLVRSTHGVLTNARPDHLDIMGPLEEDVALAMAGTVPIKGQYFTTEKTHFKIFKKASVDRKSTLIHVDQAAIDRIHHEDMAQFSYEEFKENVALALAVCDSLNIDRRVALKGMWAATPDPGAMCIYTIKQGEQTIIFANGFAANDPVSTKILWNHLLTRYQDCDDSTIIINCRADRHDRSVQLGESISTWQPASKMLMIGSGTKTFAHHLQRENWPQVINGEGWDVKQILNKLTEKKTTKQHFVFGIGNIAGIGLQLVSYFQEHKDRSC